MKVVHPCPTCRTAVEHEPVRGARVECQECGAALRFITMFDDGNLILVEPAPPPR